ncbi:MAG: hypothetical protein K2K53_11670, partial [Oscillospiraceae bacterium]|nr:hypothetical protein [Oscillospiraceae bacterium]
MSETTSQVFRCYVQKRHDLAAEALWHDLQDQLGIPALWVHILHRYDVEGISQEVFEQAKNTVFSEPQVDVVYDQSYVPACHPRICALAVEALPGQFDQRADSAAQCIQLMTGGERPLVAYATIY